MNFTDLERAIAAIGGYALDGGGDTGGDTGGSTADVPSYLDWGGGGGAPGPSAAPASDSALSGTSSSPYSLTGGSGNAFQRSRDPWSTLASRVSEQAKQPEDTSVQGWLTRLMNGDQKTSSQARFGMGALGLLGSMRQSRQGSRNQLSPAQLQAMLKTPYSNWTDGQQQAFNSYFYQPLGKFNPQPLPVGAIPPRMAAGGRTPHPHGYSCGTCHGGALSRYAGGGALVPGAAPGQSDVVPIRASPGEYVMDADVVSALGDGSNDAGAKRLDEMREAIRTHKRSAPATKIPPKAHSPLAYLRK